MVERLHRKQRRTWGKVVSTTALALAAGLTFSHCDNTIIGGGGDDPTTDAGVNPRAVTNLLITPDNDVLQVDIAVPGAVGTKTFTVRVVYADGSAEDVTSQVTLSLENAALGSLSGGTFTSVSSAATKIDFTRVIATYTANGQPLSAVANLTVVWLRTSGAATDFFFKLPYQDAAQTLPLSFNTNVQSLDSFFAVDTTGSMGPEIQQLSASLQNTIIPGVKLAVANAQFGVAAVEDFGVAPYGKPNAFAGQVDDQPLILLQTITADITAATTAVSKLLNGTAPRGNGNDTPEGQMEALYQIATGIGNVVANVVNIPANTTGIGGVGFRKGSLPVVTMITDAMFHAKGETGSCTYRNNSGTTFTEFSAYAGTVDAAAHTRAETMAALNKICAKVVGVSALYVNVPGFQAVPEGLCNSTADQVATATATGAVVLPSAWDLPSRPAGCAANQCCTGQNGVGEATNASGECPLVFKLPQTGVGLGAQVVSGISSLVRYAKFDVTTQTAGNAKGDKGETLPAGKTTADFITAITPFSSIAPVAPPVLPQPTISGGSFTKVYPGSKLTFNVVSQNNLVPATTSPQVFRATIKILAGGCADLDQREVIILVPPKPPVIG